MVDHVEVKKAPSFNLETGLGLALYPSGSVAVCASKVNGFTFTHFYDTKGSNQIIASFSLGVGFVHWPNGQPRFVATVKGGKLCDMQGRIEHEWDWECRGAFVGPPIEAPPVELRINTHMHFSCSGAFDMQLKVHMGGLKHTFAVGRPARDRNSFADRMHRRKMSGLLEGGAAAASRWPTLMERTTAAGKVNPNVAALRAAQDTNDMLPRISASGREVRSFCATLQLKATQQIVATQDASTERLAAYRTLVGRRVDSARANQKLTLAQTAALTAKRLAKADALFDTTMGREPSAASLATLRRPLPMVRERPPALPENAVVPPARVPQTRPRTPPLPLVTLSALDALLKVAPPHQVLTVLCSTRHTEGDKAMEKMVSSSARRHAYAAGASMRAAELAAELAETQRSSGDLAATAADGGGGHSEDEAAAAVEEELTATAPAAVSRRGAESATAPPNAFLLVDCTKFSAKARASEYRRVAVQRKRAGPGNVMDGTVKVRPPDLRHPLMQRYDFTNCPMFLQFYAGQLVHCAPTLNGFGKKPSDLEAQLDIARERGERGKFLPEGFSLKMTEH